MTVACYAGLGSGPILRPCLYLLGYTKSLVPFDSKGATLWPLTFAEQQWNVISSSSQLPDIFERFQPNLDLSLRIFKKVCSPKFDRCPPCGSRAPSWGQTDEQTDVIKEVRVFLEYANEPKIILRATLKSTMSVTSEQDTWRSLHAVYMRVMWRSLLQLRWQHIHVCVSKCTGKGKAVPLQAWSGPDGSKKLKFPDFMTTAQDGGKVVNLTHRPPLPPGNTPGTHFC